MWLLQAQEDKQFQHGPRGKQTPPVYPCFPQRLCGLVAAAGRRSALGPEGGRGRDHPATAAWRCLTKGGGGEEKEPVGPPPSLTCRRSTAHQGGPSSPPAVRRRVRPKRPPAHSFLSELRCHPRAQPGQRAAAPRRPGGGAPIARPPASPPGAGPGLRLHASPRLREYLQAPPPHISRVARDFPLFCRGSRVGRRIK